MGISQPTLMNQIHFPCYCKSLSPKNPEITKIGGVILVWIWDQFTLYDLTPRFLFKTYKSVICNHYRFAQTCHFTWNGIIHGTVTEELHSTSSGVEHHSQFTFDLRKKQQLLFFGQIHFHHSYLFNPFGEINPYICRWNPIRSGKHSFLSWHYHVKSCKKSKINV